VIELGLRYAQARFDVPETFPVSQLCKGHTEELIPTRKGLDLVIAVVSLYAPVKLVRWHKVHQLSKNSSPDIHKPSPSAVLRKYGRWEDLISNRKIAFFDKSSYLSMP
jgi:hypothetical protein